MVKNSFKELAHQSVIQDFTSMKVFVFMEDASMDMLPTLSEDVSEQLLFQLVPIATSINTFKVINALAHAEANSILTLPPENVCLVLQTVLLASVDHSV